MKVENLTDKEWEILKIHPQNAADIIENVDFLKDAVPIILQHHERFDGTGYPHQLKGDQIVYLARMLTVIDSFDAMTLIRPYQKRKTYSKAIEELKRCSGTQFDPKTVEIYISVIESLVTKYS